MTQDQILIFAILAMAIGLFLHGKWRHDIVALIALLTAVATGLVPSGAAFEGFGQPAVITVACVLVLSRGLQRTGAVDILARNVIPQGGNVTLSMGALVVLGTFLSAFMNNVGALALLMPMAIKMARDLDLAPGQILMPLAFGTLLGGMTTLIGTPPNLIVSGFREEIAGSGYALFDFAPVGVPVALVGVAFLVLVGWRFVPVRSGGADDDFSTGAYFTELSVKKNSKLIGGSLREAEDEMAEAGAQIVRLVRNQVAMTAPRGRVPLSEGDILVVEAELDALSDILSSLGLGLVEDERAREAKEKEAAAQAKAEEKARAEAEKAEAQEDAGGEEAAEQPAQLAQVETRQAEAAPVEVPAADGRSGGKAGEGDATDGEDKQDADPKPRSEVQEIILREYVLRPESEYIGRSPLSLSLRTRFGINLLALSRSGARRTNRLRSIRFQSGDLILLQGPPESLSEFATAAGAVPLAERSLDLPDRRMALFAVLIMVGAIAIAVAGLLPTPVSFMMAVVASIMLGTVPLRELYTSIDWSVIVLLAALIPVAGAMETTGAAALVAQMLVDNLAGGSVLIALSLVLIVTMTLSDAMNNAATAAVMCPIAIGIAVQLGASPDQFLMAVAIGASCSFLTPIGHQNNTLILGPGGFRFGDYWKLGLILEIIVAVTAIPLLMFFWS
ncbi:MAG: SLC13 family permease [Paracoccus sp. (in: a-proteobacteria)]|nr:SLC13 family permease [Paracoccus sp. (in: a-proteobacteria)]